MSAAPAILDEETIRWISVKDALPDADATVMVFAPGADEPVWLGWYEGEGVWHSVDAAPYDPDTVTAWATLPMGPKR